MNNILQALSGTLILWLILDCFVFFLTIIIHLSLDRKPLRILISSAETFVTLVLVQILIYQHIMYRAHGGRLLVMLAINLALTSVAVTEILSCIRIRSSSLTLMSIKECMDELPVGICFYRDGGLTKLTNRKMDSIACRLTGSGIMDAEGFRKKIFDGADSPIVHFDDGTAYNFVHMEDTLDSRPIHELLAFDITEEYRLTAELSEKQKKAAKINTRLKALNSTIQYIIMDRETLQIKINIHDSFGRMLLMTRHYLTDCGGTDAGEILSQWRRNIALLKGGERERWQKPHFFSQTHADSLGIKLDITGSLPEDEALSSIADTAITAHVTNVLRHADGNIAYITSKETDAGFELHFKNNGAAPEKEVKETGGLANLRQRVEAAGGTMKIYSSPEFELVIYLPREETS